MAWLRRSAYLVIVLAIIAAAVSWRFGFQHWLAHATGSYNCPPAGCPGGSPHNYNFWSGSGSDIGQVTLIGIAATAALAWWHKINCHTAGCWRIGRHEKAGGEFVVCRRCHNKIEGHQPGHKLTIEHLRERHLAHREAHRGAR